MVAYTYTYTYLLEVIGNVIENLKSKRKTEINKNLQQFRISIIIIQHCKWTSRINISSLYQLVFLIF